MFIFFLVFIFVGVVRLFGHVHSDRARIVPRNAQGQGRADHSGHVTRGRKKVKIKKKNLT
jgi:hypothetical protein